MTTRLSDLLAEGAAQLAAAGVEGGARDAELILRWAAGLDAAGLSARLGDDANTLPPEAAARLADGLAARAARSPVSHIVGGRYFWGRWFEVTPDVLDPRPETEVMVAAALDGPAPTRVLDLGVGSGCLLATMLAERPGATGLGVDASRAALAVAARNLAAHGADARAEVKLGDWCDGLLEGFDLILCNPPYIAEDEMPGLAPEVLGHEPRLALTPGGDGLDAYRRIAPELAAYLRRKGRAFFEIGPDQAAAVQVIFGAFGWSGAMVHRDMDGRDRCLEFRRK